MADAGYGKTTLLADFSRNTRLRTIWYRLDQEDADVVTFVRYLHAACREVAPGFGEATAALLRDIGGLGSPPDVLVDTLVRDLASLSDVPSVLVLDDVHALDRSAGRPARPPPDRGSRAGPVHGRPVGAATAAGLARPPADPRRGRPT